MKIRVLKYCLICLAFFLGDVSIYSQNLIPNSGFENWDGTSGSGGNTLDGLFNWYTANGTADHHHTSLSGSNLTGLDPCPLGQGNTDCGYTVEGEAVLGAWKGNGIDGTREWAGVELTEPLIPGDCYTVSFWVQNKEDDPNNLYETNQWGLFFSETEVPDFSVNVTDYTSRLDQIVMTEEVVNDTIWHYFEYSYLANEPYEYVFLGYQGNVSSSTFTVANNDPFLGFYVWFDEVSIEKIITPQLTTSNDTIICNGDSVLVEANSNYPVIWTNLGPDTTSSFWVSPENSTTYYVQTQDSTNCTILDSVVVTVNRGENIAFQDSVLVCLGTDPFIIENSTSDGFWSGVGIIDSLTSLFDPNIAGSGNHQLYYTSNNDCSENFTVEVEIQETPSLEFVPDIQKGCSPLEVVFTDLTPIVGTDYNWDFGNLKQSNQIGSASTIYEEPGNYDVNLMVSYSNYCDATINYIDVIEVGETPVANFTYSPSEVIIPGGGVQFEDQSTSNVVEWMWDFGDGKFDSSVNPFHEYTEPGTYDVLLIATTSEGCLDSIVQRITVKNNVTFYIPNIFSPNNDGINDLFEIAALGPIESFNLSLYNRWGELIFKTDNLSTYWDGKIKNQYAQPGVYAYFIEYSYFELENSTLNKEIINGTITIIK